MIIHMDGTAQELLDFVKDMQFPVAMGFADLEDKETEREIAEEVRKNFEMDDTQAEVEKDIERLLTEAKKQTGESVNRGTIQLELHCVDLANLRAEANKRGLTGCELAENIITAWLDKQNKARV